MELELDRELRFHIGRETEENIALGMAPAEARTAALRRIGGVAQVEEECRDMRRVQYVEQMGQDLRYALRSLAKSPGFTAVIVLTLGLSIGANSAIFSVIQGVLLKPLPYPAADRLVRIFYHNANYAKFPVNHFDLRDIRATNRSFEGVAGYTHSDLQLSGPGDPVKLSAFRVTAKYFGVLGIPPARGRDFDFSDELPGNGRVRHSQRPRLAHAVRRRARCAGAQDPARRATVHDHRCHAAGHGPSRQFVQSGVVRADGGHLDAVHVRRQSGAARIALRGGDRTAEAGRHPGAGASGVHVAAGRDRQLATPRLRAGPL